jgi:Na+/H+-dicarboxylate symporter
MQELSSSASKKTPLHIKMLIGFVVGIGAGVAAHYFAFEQAWLSTFIEWVTRPAGDIFLRLLFMLVIPLLFSALILGVAELGDLRKLGRIGWRTLGYTVLVSSLAVLIGVGLVNVIRPGDGIDNATRAQLLEGAAERAATVTNNSAAAPATGVQLLVNIVPKNIVEAASKADVLGVMFFALMFGIALCVVRTPAAQTFQQAVQGVYDIAMWLIDKVIRLAPYAVACLMFNLTAELGYTILKQLAAFVGTAVLAMALHQFMVYPLVLKFAAGVSPMAFFRNIQEAMLTAFSTASSNATLPTSLKVAEERLKLPPQISRFVLTVGATANQNGTALFEGVAVLFLAQFFGVDLTLGQQFTVVMICILGGIGTAGVPAGSIPVVAMILAIIGVKPEGIGLILGVDRFLDMCRTTLNVTGDLVIATAVSKGEKATDTDSNLASG